MRSVIRRSFRHILHVLGRYPAFKRMIVSLIYRFPALDATLRTAAHRVIHPEAVLDVDATSLPDESRRAYERMRGSPRP
jgi:hypothetical protein